MIFVVAGSVVQAREWAKDHKVLVRDYRYVSSVNVLRGYTNVKVAYTGTYYARRDLGEIQDYLAFAGSTDFVPSEK